MSSIRSLLPEPKGKYEVYAESKTTVSRRSRPEQPRIPPYLQRTKGFIPRNLADFVDGGAYPEIHLSQYPRNMGRKDNQTSNVLTVHVDKQGKASYDAVATQGQGKKSIYSSFTDIVEKRVSKEALERPTLEEEQETARKTREALENLVNGKISAAQPVNIARQKTAEESSSFFRYTPNPNAPGYNPEVKQRVIRMVEAPIDPMEPPKFKHKKAPRGPPSPPVPVLHSPPRKITVKDQQSWKIPPCVSNWKNAKGYTIPLDKRLAADGRGLQEITINDNFASLSEALAIAERKAREEVNMRAQVQKKLSMKEKEQKEAELRDLASRARMERAGIETSSGGRDRRDSAHDEDDDGRLDREKIRRDRKREREREMRMEKLGKKGKLARDSDRDISEKIALGQLQGTGAQSGEGLFDSRLFNQSQGMDSGFGKEDEYNVYSKPMHDRGEAGSVYRPKKGSGDMYGDADKQLEDLRKSTDKFRPDKDFKGVDRSSGAKRDGPVQFEHEQKDPFGLDQFLTEARSGKKAMDRVGKHGGMEASAGSASREEYMSGSSRQSKRAIMALQLQRDIDPVFSSRAQVEEFCTFEQEEEKVWLKPIFRWKPEVDEYLKQRSQSKLSIQRLFVAARGQGAMLTQTMLPEKARCLGTFLLPETHMSPQPFLTETRTCRVVALDNEFKNVALISDTWIPSDRANDWVEELFQHVSPERIVMLDSLTDNGTFEICSSEIVKLSTTHRMPTTPENAEEEKLLASISNLKSPPMVFGSPAAILSHCEFRRIPAVLLLLPDGSDLNQCLPHLASIAEVYFQTAFKKNQLQQASHEQPQQPHHLYI